jgi:tRNA-uridine 2-sulfurtransferase
LKALALLSGGLDSTLAIKLVQDQGIDVVAVNFTSPFCTCTPKNASCSAAVSASRQLGVPVRVLTKGIDYFRIVQNPKFGYGSGMNPCIDCRIYILKKAKELMDQEGASFLITGEVIGQRPKSQNRETLRLIEKEAEVEGILVRPLCAKLLPPTIPEREGWLDREQLQTVNGRGRKAQFSLAKRFHVNDYPCPAGGCLLTDKNVARRLSDLFHHLPDFTLRDIMLLRFGRHIRLGKNTRMILSRNEEESNRLQSFFNPHSEILLHSVSPSGPSALLLENEPGEGLRTINETVLPLMHRYSDAGEGETLCVRFEGRVSGEAGTNRSVEEERLSAMLV